MYAIVNNCNGENVRFETVASVVSMIEVIRYAIQLNKQVYGVKVNMCDRKRLEDAKRRERNINSSEAQFIPVYATLIYHLGKALYDANLNYN